MSEEPSQSEIKESINRLAKKMAQKIIEDARLKIESGFAEEPTTEEYWKAESLSGWVLPKCKRLMYGLSRQPIKIYCN